MSVDADLIRFTFGMDAASDLVSIWCASTGAAMTVPAAELPMLADLLRTFDPQSLRSERPVLDLSE